MDGSVEGDIPELSYSPIVVAVYLVWGLLFILIVAALCTVGLFPLASHVRCCACFKRKPVTKLQMDIEPYFTSLNSLARLTVGTAENINVEGKFEGKREFDSQPTFPEELPHSVHHDTRRLESPKSSLEDDSKTIFDFNSKTSSSIDSIKCEYIY